MSRFDLYKKLKEQGFPQGGNGYYIVHPDTNEKVYVPKPEEIYSQFISSPEGWIPMVDAMSNVWLENIK